MTPSSVLLAFVVFIWTLPMTAVAVMWREKITAILQNGVFANDSIVERKIGAAPVQVVQPESYRVAEGALSDTRGDTPDVERSYWGRRAGTRFYVAPVPRAEATVTALGPDGPEQRQARVYLN